MLFVAVVFLSAALVFLVEPMVAKLVLPLLGGTPAVWNTCLAFFQISLLAGYLYAHLLQRVRSVRTQAMIHVGVLVLAAVALPLRINLALGDPDPAHPILWLLATLALSIGAPFAALSATAPLVQAWRARLQDPDDKTEPYALYAASNLGSLIALIAYPVLVEPLMTLQGQKLSWSIGYGLFIVTLATLAFLAIRGRGHLLESAPSAAPVRWKDRLTWIGLAAAPSSLMLGVTAYLTTDVASAPFLWVAPLALYLVTFIIAFQTKPAIPRELALTLGAAAVACCAYLLPFHTNDILLQMGVHLTAFFFTALICHQALVAKRPDAAHLTEFYLWMSVGGVVGGAFNAFLAPVIFNIVLEYPLVLVLAVFARPFDDSLQMTRNGWLLLIGGILAALAAVILMSVAEVWPVLRDISAVIPKMTLVKTMLAVTLLAAFMMRRNLVAFPGLLVILLAAAGMVGDQVKVVEQWRSFFGVARQSTVDIDRIGDGVVMLAHGTTLHGAQAPAGPLGCKPMVYYAEETPIGQVFVTTKAARPSINIGAVGLGTGTVSTYVRATDKLSFFEIDPLMVEIATNPKYFSYISQCADGPIDFVLGDARLTLNKESNDKYDILLIDAFSSDAVPAHLLTVEALKMYLTKIKPDGIVILHLSNRNLDLMKPAQAAAIAAGGHALLQRHTADPDLPFLWESAEDAVIIARSEAALAPYASDARWSPVKAQVRPWTDDYTNLVGALISRTTERWQKKDEGAD